MDDSTPLEVGEHYTFTDSGFEEFTGKVTFHDSVFTDVELTSDARYCDGTLYRKEGETIILSSLHIKAVKNR